MNRMNMSNYFNKLVLESKDIADRYLSKLEMIGFVDPYTIKKEDLEYIPDAFPPVSSMDIVSYLVLTHSFYTKEQMKAHKSLSAYKYFEAGFVQQCGAVRIRDSIVVVGKTKHSQRMNKSNLDVWMICHMDGSVLSAHCTCMAGASEVCSHVGAVLYAIEYVHANKSSMSCTDVKSQWMVPCISKVEMTRVSEMNWGEKSCVGNKKRQTTVPGADFKELLKNIEEAGSSSAIMRVIEPFASNFEVSTGVLNIFNIYQEEFVKLNYEELRQLGDSYSFSVSDEVCQQIKDVTKMQSQSSQWFKQREGRITASKFKAACRTSLTKPSVSLIKSVCYPLKMAFTSKAVAWGIKHEKTAIDAYINITSREHTDFAVTSVGLCINPGLPQFGASPDGIIKCSCCGIGTLEVKCPYLFKNKSTCLDEYASHPTTCLIKEDGDMFLKIDHTYFYQIQMQMHLTGAAYCDFVIWYPSETFIQRIFPDNDFWQQEVVKAMLFHKNIIVPELLGRFFTRSEGKAVTETWCVCKSADNGRPMIQCENDDCEVQWYHLECLGLLDVPNQLWLCDICKTKM